MLILLITHWSSLLGGNFKDLALKSISLTNCTTRSHTVSSSSPDSKGDFVKPAINEASDRGCNFKLFQNLNISDQQYLLVFTHSVKSNVSTYRINISWIILLSHLHTFVAVLSREFTKTGYISRFGWNWTETRRN